MNDAYSAAPTAPVTRRSAARTWGHAVLAKRPWSARSAAARGESGSRRSGRAATKAALAAAVALGWVGGYTSAGAAIAQPVYQHIGLFAEVLGLVENRYVDAPDQEVLMEGAIRGMLGELDPYTVYLSPTEFAALRSDTQGEYVGVGVTIRPEPEGVRIVDVFANGPAARAGIVAGDLLVGIAGDPTPGFTNEDVMERLRGRRGVAVDVLLQREGHEGTIALTVIRDVIQVEAVLGDMPVPGYAHITVRQFQADVSADVRAAIDRLQSDYGAPLLGVVLDLRGDPGGLLDEAVSLSDLFMSEGTIVTTRGRTSRPGEFVARRSTTRYNGPLAVLVDGGSASASEIVAGALQDSGRALLVGSRTYGKGSVQTTVELPNGAGLKITVSRYFTPSGRSIDGEGIAPDVEVAVDAAAEEPTQASTLDLSSVDDAALRVAIDRLAAP